jgi:hypothetical protein
MFISTHIRGGLYRSRAVADLAAMPGGPWQYPGPAVLPRYRATTVPCTSGERWLIDVKLLSLVYTPVYVTTYYT